MLGGERVVPALDADQLGVARQLPGNGTPGEVEDHVQYMADFATRLEGTGEYVDGQALSPQGTFVSYDGEGRPPVCWMVIDVDTYERALALAGELSAASGAGASRSRVA